MTTTLLPASRMNLGLRGGSARRLKGRLVRCKPTKGGDGGILGLVELEDARGNKRTVLVSVPPDAPGLVETLDPADRAHGVRVWHPKLGWMLVAAVDEDGRPAPGLEATPRRYPASQMTSRGVAIDSAFDLFYERLRALEGITLDAGNMSDARWKAQRGAFDGERRGLRRRESI